DRLRGGTCGSPARRQERRQIDEPDSMGQSRQDIREVLDRIDSGESAGAEDGEGDGGAIAAGVCACEEEVLASQRGPDMESLDDAVVEWQEAVLEEAAECDLMVRQVLECLTERRRWWFVLLADCAPGDELVPDGLTARASLDQPGVGITIPNLGLDLVELLVRGERERGALVAGIERLHEVAPRVHVASTLDEVGALEARVEHVRGVRD